VIQKKNRLIIAFHSTHDAIAFEAACERSGAGGRLIPLPKEISAGCGLAWSASLEEKQLMISLLESESIEAEKIQICMV
jgi:hypothetical protein